MIDLKEAIERAKQFITELNGEPEQFQVEEAILSKDKKNWIITLSYYKSLDSPNQLQQALGFASRRAYKSILIDNKTEEIIGLIDGYFKKSEAA